MADEKTGILTTAGKSYIAARALANLGLDIANVVLANVPNLNELSARNANMAKPPNAQIVYDEPYQVDGFIDDNTVAWSIVLDQDMGDFDYNWIGLTTDDGTLLALDYLPLQRKRTGVNNVHTRSFVLNFAAAKSLTRIDMPAESWMFDYSPRLDDMQSVLIAQATGIIEAIVREVSRDDELAALNERIRINENKFKLMEVGAL